MKTVKIAIMGLAMVVSIAVIGVAANTMGADRFALDGGGKGEIDFPHKIHQETLGDCKACHDVFPKELGVIKKMKTQKTLKRKQVMNDTCIACHKAYKAEGKKFGPIRCNECHKR